MNMIRSDAPAVWVLIFDRQPAGCEFDRLDLESTYFEQFLLQDVRNDFDANIVLGGDPALLRLSKSMTELEQTASVVRITTDCDDTTATANSDGHGMEAPMRRCHIPLLTATELNVQNLTDAKLNSGKSEGLDHAFSANLVWIEAQVASAKHPATAATQILNFVLDQLEFNAQHEQKCPVLLATFRRGEDFTMSEPLKSGVAENSMHVPLWIRPNVGHACRVQAIAGSFDLLPTIATFLGSANASVEVRPPDVAQIADLSDRVVTAALLSSDPHCLAFLCGAPQVCQDRLLKLRGDGWIAGRTEEFLLVISDTNESDADETESDGDSPEEPSRRLYVKPDDRFNVHDVSGTYATVVEELSRVLKNLD